MKQYYKLLEQLGDVECALLDALDDLTPSDRCADNVAIPLCNRLEERGEAIREAVNLMRDEIESLLGE